MKKGKLIGKIFGIALVFVLIGSMFAGVASATPLANSSMFQPSQGNPLIVDGTVKLKSLEASLTAHPQTPSTIPSTIRVARRELGPDGNPDPNGEILRVDEVNFKTYVKRVLPHEWIASWRDESLKAGAVAVKMYAWYWIGQGGKYPEVEADVDDSINCQVYIEETDPRTNAAVDNTWSVILMRDDALFETQYWAGDYSGVFPTGKWAGRMSQWGSKYWADHGRTFAWMLRYYYGYDRQAACDYAQEYWDEVCSDGYFWMWDDVKKESYLIELDPGTNVNTDYYNQNSVDCAHFVSCCIGRAGGVAIPSRTNAYGEPGAHRLGEWLLNMGLGVRRSSVNELKRGDVILYDWDGKGRYDHAALYVGNERAASHSRSVYDADWQLKSVSHPDGAKGHWFIHIRDISIDKGLGWLSKYQNLNGSWQNRVGITSMAALAFLNADHTEDDPTVNNAIQYILAHRNPDGSFAGYGTYETSAAVWALVATHNPDYNDEISDAKDWLVNAQYDDTEGVDSDNPYWGGWSYGSNPSWADLSNTQFALMALDAAGLPKSSATWTKAITYVSRCQNKPASEGHPGNDQDWAYDNNRPSYNDGGFIYCPEWSFVGQTGSYGSITAGGIWSLRLCGVGVPDERVQAGLNWLIDNEDCSFDDNPGYPYDQGHCFLYYYYMTTAKALTMCFLHDLGGVDWYAALSTRLANLQHDDGHWANAPAAHGQEDIAELATDYALLALQTKQPPPAELWMSIILASNAELCVYDPQGRHARLGDVTIPGATFEIDEEGRQIVNLEELEAGKYRIELTGTADGGYSLTIEGYRDEDQTSSETIEGSIEEGEIQRGSALVTSMVGALTIYVEEPETTNHMPVADAGPDQTVCVIPPATTAMVTLDGSGSYDPDGDPLTYTWTWGGNTAYGVNPTVELPLGTTTITLVVNDGKVDSEPDTVDITVQIPATIDFDPDVLNLDTKGKYVTAYIELPLGYDVSQIDIGSIRLNGTVPALGKPSEIGDYDNDGHPDLMVKFHRTAVQDALTVGEEVEVTITGEVAGIGFEGSDTISRVITPTPPGRSEWARVSTPTTEGWVLAPDSIIVDYALADGGDVAYAILYIHDTDVYYLLKSTDGAATWEDITDELEDMLDDNDYIVRLLRVATDNVDPDFVAVALDMWDDSDGTDEMHMFISTDGGATFEDTGEVEDGGVVLPGGGVFDLAVSIEDDGVRDIAIGGTDWDDALIFRCQVFGDFSSGWEDARYDGWDDDGTFTSLAVVDIHFAPSWAADKTILVATATDTAGYLQSGTWETSEGWNAQSVVGIDAAPIVDGAVTIPWLSLKGLTAGITTPLDYAGRNSDQRYVWVNVNYYDPFDGPAGKIFRVKNMSVTEVNQQIEDLPWLTNVSYRGTIAEGEAIAGVLGNGLASWAECCEGVQVYRNDGVANMDICCIFWEEACKPPTGRYAMEAFYVSEDKAYAVAFGPDPPWDEGAWSVSFDEGDTWNQLSLVDTHIDYLSDVAVSPDCNKTTLVSANLNHGSCYCDSVWLHAENLPEAIEYSGKWLRTWCGQLENNYGLLRLAPEEITGDNVYLVDYGTNNLYWNNLETLACWDRISSPTVTHIVDLAAKDADILYAMDISGEVAMFDENEWQEGVDSKVEHGWTITVRGDDILVGGCDGDVSHSDDGGETFTELDKIPVAADYTLITVAFDSYFDANDTIYAAVAGFEGSSPTTGGIYRWVIGESDEWEDLGAEDYVYTGLVLNVPSGGKPKTSPDTGGVLYASYVSGDTTGVARCLTPAEDVCCSGTDWDYLTRGLTSEIFYRTPQALKICGCLTADIGSRLFAIDSSEYYDMVEGLTGTVWSFED